jgi:hypothetical protein
MRPNAAYALLRVLRGHLTGNGPTTAVSGATLRIEGPDGRCRLLDSGEALSAPWIARYLNSGNERKRVPFGLPPTILARSAGAISKFVA